jgi:hypothetical protein
MLPAVVLAVAAAGLTGCTHHGSPAPPSTPGGSQGPVASNVKVTFLPGEFRYLFGNIDGSFSFHGSAGTLRIQNQSGDTVGPPGLYVITGDDKRFDGTVAGAAPIPKGADVTFEVAFPSEVMEKTVGLLVLTLGSDNMGAMAPAASPAP